MVAKSVFGGLVRTRPDFIGDIGSEHHPGGQGSNIYHLIRVPTAQGPQLIGSVSKGTGIINFSTGETLHDFSDLGPGPMLAADSYVAQALWTNPETGRLMLYLGGWVKRPAIIGPTNNHTNKYGWVGEWDAETLEFQRYLVLDKAQAANSWQGEVTQLIPTQERLFILRGDIELGSAPSLASLHGYTYAYDGTDVAPGDETTVVIDGLPDITLDANVVLFENIQSKKGGIYGDELLLANEGQGVSVFDLIDGADTRTDFVYSTVTMRALGGPGKTVSGTFRSEFAQLGGMLWHGTTNGYFLGDPRVSNDVIFMPVLASPNGGAGLARAFGWRSRVVQAEGGLIFSANADLFGRTDAIHSFLLYLGYGGTLKVLRTGGAFAGLEVHDGRLYYGVANEPHTDIYSNYKDASPQLASMPLEDIHNAPPPAFTERVSYTAYTAGASGNNGYLGGYPTIGYRDGGLWLTSTVAGTLTLSAWSIAKSSASATVRRDIGTVVFGAGETKYVDLASLEGLDRSGGIGQALGGGAILGWKFSVDTSLVGQISLQP